MKGRINIVSTPAIDRYIDRNIVDEYADKSLKYGYSLNINDIPTHDLSNLIDFMLKHDGGLKDLVLDHIQDHVDERLNEMEKDHRCEIETEHGFRAQNVWRVA